MVYTPRGYTTIADIEDYLLIDIIASFEDRVKEWIAMMEKFVEKETGRVFIADTEEEASVKNYQISKELAVMVGRYFETKRSLLIADCVKVLELKIDGIVITPTDYLFYPANELPITRIKLKDDSGLSFASGEQNIEVKAQWGYSVKCPADINFATTVLVAGIINFSGNMEGEVKSESIGSYSVTFKEAKDWQDFERAKEILQQYKKIVI